VIAGKIRQESFRGARPVLRRQRRSAARAAGLLLSGGSLLVVLSLLLPHPSGGNTTVLVALAVAMMLGGALCVRFAGRVPLPLTHAALAAAVVAAAGLTLASGVAAGQYGSIFVWATLIAGYYFPRRLVAAHLGWILVVYATTLALVPSTAGYSPLTRWLFTAISLSVVAVLTTALVARRQSADLRARRFFDLSRDMLCTSDLHGYFVELNQAWEECLGFSREELRAVPFVDRVHPDDRERTAAEAGALFQGAGSVGFENRYLAKDGSVHWLRWSATLAPDESLIYARAADVTELKKVEAEREALLREVGEMARSDALTGLPNRRALDEALPREMARARRSQSSLCLAIVDIDHFKAYNDSRGHLAGDVLLRDCAAAWDAELRGEDMLVRFGGEEFLVMLPDCEPDDAVEIVERLRAATPDGQTCSGGLVRWDGIESIEDLLARADAGLYEAKGAGRDQLVRIGS
jgi:diguanylate cyclase (GGDEF)-like protein/PAS domain S-box-containing protein